MTVETKRTQVHNPVLDPTVAPEPGWLAGASLMSSGAPYHTLAAVGSIKSIRYSAVGGSDAPLMSLPFFSASPPSCLRLCALVPCLLVRVRLRGRQGWHVQMNGGLFASKTLVLLCVTCEVK